MAGRQAKRFRCAKTIPIGFLGANARVTGDLLDLSTTGVLIRCSQELEPGTMGRIGIPVGQETARIVAVVRRRLRGIGVAFEFSRMGPHDRELLQRLLMRLSKPSSS